MRAEQELHRRRLASEEPVAVGDDGVREELRTDDQSSVFDLDAGCRGKGELAPAHAACVFVRVRAQSEAEHRRVDQRFELARDGFCPPDIRDLDDVIECVADRYDRIADQRPHDRDVHFMLAAAEYLDGREVAARRAIKDALEYGDCSRAATNLACLVDVRVDRHLARR